MPLRNHQQESAMGRDPKESDVPHAHGPAGNDDLDVLTQDELASAMTFVLPQDQAANYAEELFRAKAAGEGPFRATGFTLAYAIMVSPELAARVRAHLRRGGNSDADIDAFLERARQYLASLAAPRNDNAV
jgi:hypothetical protein